MIFHSFTYRYWANVTIPHESMEFHAVCPFCTTPLDGSPGYIKLIFPSALTQKTDPISDVDQCIDHCILDVDYNKSDINQNDRPNEEPTEITDSIREQFRKNDEKREEERQKLKQLRQELEELENQHSHSHQVDYM